MVGHGRAIVAVDKSQRQQPRGATLDYASELAALSAAALFVSAYIAYSRAARARWAPAKPGGGAVSLRA